jgi:hypothetical protein
LRAAVGLLVGLGLLWATQASAQFSEASTKRAVTIRTTSPVLKKCQTWTRGGCFRILLELSGTTDDPVAVGYDLNRGYMGDSHAYITSGVACTPAMVSGIAVNYSNRQWTKVGRTTPARAIVDFGCDGPVRSGDTVLIDLSFWLASSGGDNAVERFAFPQLTVR